MAALTGKKVVVIHGWSDNWKSMKKVGNPLKAQGANVFYANYDSREDSAVYEDFAEGLHQEMEAKGLLNTAPRSLNFVTHSTGALVLRQWFKQYPQQREKVGNVVFLAPTNFGSPLATIGNSLIGKVFKGKHGAGGDNFEVGKKILHGLELASPYSWQLAEYDLLGPNGSIYSKNGIRASVITGHKAYGGLRRFVNKPGTDGTIVVSGANLNVRYLQLDFSGRSGRPTSTWNGFGVSEKAKRNLTPPNLPLAIHKNLDHATILHLQRNSVLSAQVVRCLGAPPNEYGKIQKDFSVFTESQTHGRGDLNYQQILFRVVDERNMPVCDYHLEFNVWEIGKLRKIQNGPRHVPDSTKMNRREKIRSGQIDEILEKNLHMHSQDSSYKRFLIRPDELQKIVGNEYVVTMRIDAHSGDPDITYVTEEIDNFLLYHPKPDFPVKIRPFFPNTTTLIQIRINRESTLVELKD